MANDEEVESGLAKCESCGSVFPVQMWSNGTIRPFGKQGCLCTDAEFVVLETSDDTDGE